MQNLEYAIDPQVILDAKSNMKLIRIMIRKVRKDELAFIKFVRLKDPNYEPSEEFSGRSRLWGFKGSVNWRRGLCQILESLFYNYRTQLQAIREIKIGIKNMNPEEELELIKLYRALFDSERAIKSYRFQFEVIARLAGDVIGGQEMGGELCQAIIQP